MKSAFASRKRAVRTRRGPSALPGHAGPDIGDERPLTTDASRRLNRNPPGVITDGRVQGIVGVSRSIGDGRFKSLGVIAQPNVLRCTLTPAVRWPWENVCIVLRVVWANVIPRLRLP